MTTVDEKAHEEIAVPSIELRQAVVTDEDNGAQEEPEPDIMREPVTIDLLFPKTFDGKEYTELEFKFHSLSRNDLDALEKSYNATNANAFEPVLLKVREYKELVAARAANVSPLLIRSLEGSDNEAACALAFEWLGKSAARKKRRRKQ